MRGTEVKVRKGLGQGVLPADTPHIKLGPCPEGCALEVSQRLVFHIPLGQLYVRLSSSWWDIGEICGTISGNDFSPQWQERGREGSPLLSPSFLQLWMLSWEAVAECSSNHLVTMRWILRKCWRWEQRNLRRVGSLPTYFQTFCSLRKTVWSHFVSNILFLLVEGIFLNWENQLYTTIAWLGACLLSPPSLTHPQSLRGSPSVNSLGSREEQGRWGKSENPNPSPS